MGCYPVIMSQNHLEEWHRRRTLIDKLGSCGRFENRLGAKSCLVQRLHGSHFSAQVLI